jgi:uncharacterized protein
MRVFDSAFDLSASDLSSFLSCRHRTALDMAEALGLRKRPYFGEDPLLQLLIERGLEHEAAYVNTLRAEGLSVVDLSAIGRSSHRRELIDATLSAMRAGADVIVQGGLLGDRWFGKPDIMRRVKGRPSNLGSWSYEIADTKLARETRAGTILQLGLYSELLADTQGARPEHFYVITPDPDAPIHEYRVDEYSAYFRLMRRQLEATVARDHAEVALENYPEPVEHCLICSWITECKKKRALDDHLSLVANIARTQRRELVSNEVPTLTALATMSLPVPFKPRRGGIEGYERVHHQARLQLASRGRIPPLHELRAFAPAEGLCRLPAPSPGDLFLDLEGDAFAREGGREYLFGVATVGGTTGAAPDDVPGYRAWWAFTDGEERAAFEEVIDLIMTAVQAHPGMHVYHYAPYEQTAFKRLMGRYATRERELDTLLRGERFVDLFAVVRQGIVAGIERYSIKDLEPLYAFARDVPLADARRQRNAMEQALEMRCADRVPQATRDVVEGYNRDDCISTLRLREWLESLRTGLESSGTPVPRPEPKTGEASAKVDERGERVSALRSRLLRDVPDARAERDGDQQARWLLAYLLDWHRREAKQGWWKYFELCKLPEEDLLDEQDAVAGLELVSRALVVTNRKTARPTGTVVDRYRYPAQEMEISPKDDVKLQNETPFGRVVALDRSTRTIDIRKGKEQAEHHPRAVFAHTFIGTEAQEDALLRLGDGVAAAGTIAGANAASAVACELLLRRPPRLRSGAFVQREGETDTAFAMRIVGDLDDTVLAIQGPPGSGKTYTGARMICELVRQGKRVGVTGPSHKVIRLLLDGVLDAAREMGLDVRAAHKIGTGDDVDPKSPVRELTANPATLEALRAGEIHVLGGTSWLWAREDFARSVDVLFVDEAGQISLANTLAVSAAAGSIVLLGDPQQLDQPQKGSHPDGVDASALEHILGDHKTIPDDRGIFLKETWRLCPNICTFTSELFYESRLEPRPGLERQALSGVHGIEGSGLWVMDVAHDGNRNSSYEEIDAITDLVARLTAPESRWMNKDGESKEMTLADVLIVAPYNAHVTRLIERLGPTARVGTVDKFQGQEAPVVIYSMATSRPEDAPRGMEFLYSLNRLNVATSRARCAAILVASQRLYEPECRTPRQMKLANALCRYRELARVIAISPRAPS